MHVADARIVAGHDDAGAGLKATQEHFAGVKIGRRYADCDRRRARGAADLKRDGGSDLAAKRVDRAERTIVGRQDFIADQNASLMRRRALDRAGHESAALAVGLGECPDPRIGHVALRERPVEATMLERADEYVGELIIGGILWRIKMSVGGSELPQHRIDRGRRVLPRARGDHLRTVAGLDRLPVEAVQARIVEAIARQLPDLVEVRRIQPRPEIVELASGLGARRPGAECGGARHQSQNIPARRFH